jgi:hypothetical protein
MRPALLRAYCDTRYDVAGIEIRVGRRCPAMDRLLLSHRVHTAVFITAFNPFSRVMPHGWNQRMQARLQQAVRRRLALPAQGSLQRWTEAHLLVLSDPMPMRKLARHYRQYGIVIVRRGQPAWLALISQAGLSGGSPTANRKRKIGCPPHIRRTVDHGNCAGNLSGGTGSGKVRHHMG